jgi:hypothetical protein
MRKIWSSFYQCSKGGHVPLYREQAKGRGESLSLSQLTGKREEWVKQDDSKKSGALPLYFLTVGLVSQDARDGYLRRGSLLVEAHTFLLSSFRLHPPPARDLTQRKLLPPSPSLGISSLCEAELLEQMYTVPGGCSQIISQQTSAPSLSH